MDIPPKIKDFVEMEIDGWLRRIVSQKQPLEKGAE
jgi:hypothetical protein